MDFVEHLSSYSPKWSLPVYLAVFLAAALLFLCLWKLTAKRHWNRKRVLAAYFLGFYLFMVFASTVFTRPKGTEFTYELALFWSYRWGIATHGAPMVEEILLNCIMLLPLGALLPFVMARNTKIPHNPFRTHPFVSTLLTGFLTTLSIELLQLVLKRGLFEFDDIIHNTLGTALGYGIYRLVRRRNRHR